MPLPDVRLTALDLFGLIESSSTNTVRIESADIFGGNDPDLTVVIDGNLSVLGQTISGVFTFKKTASETILEMAGGVLDLNAGPVRVVRLTDGTGKFLLLGGDLAGSASLTIAAGPTLPNIDISGSTLSLRFNTASEAVSTIDGEAVDLPAGDYYRLAGNAVMAVGIPEVDLTGDFVFEPRDADSVAMAGLEPGWAPVLVAFVWFRVFDV